MAVLAAVAVELTHDFSLLHDDVMDRDLTRRHGPAAWTVFGVGQAILVGDALLAAAIQAVDSQPLARVLTSAVLELCAGQSQDLAFESRSDVDLTECVLMAERKTGALFGAACELGALSANTGPDVAEAYRGFGLRAAKCRREPSHTVA